MSENTLSAQAEKILSALPRIMRTIFQAGDDDKTMELPIGQAKVCLILGDGPQTMSALSEMLGITHSAITQIADRLERSGLVERIPEEDDRRVRILRLTPDGVDMIDRRRSAQRGRILRVLDTLPPELRSTIVNALEILLHAGQATFPMDIPGTPESGER